MWFRKFIFQRKKFRAPNPYTLIMTSLFQFQFLHSHNQTPNVNTILISVVFSDIHKNYLMFQHFITGSTLSCKLSEKAN